MSDARSLVEDFLLADGRTAKRRRGEGMKNKIVTAAEAIAIIRDGDTVACSGFVGSGTPDELIAALEQRFVETGAPRDLTLVFAAAPGDGKDRGLNRLAHDGAGQARDRRSLGAGAQARRSWRSTDKIEAYNLPLGTLTQLFRDIAGHRAGTLTKVGLRTFVDPRQGGGKINARTDEDLVRADGDRRRGVAVLQGVSDHRGASSAAPPPT